MSSVLVELPINSLTSATIVTLRSFVIILGIVLVQISRSRCLDQCRSAKQFKSLAAFWWLPLSYIRNKKKVLTGAPPSSTVHPENILAPPLPLATPHWSNCFITCNFNIDITNNASKVPSTSLSKYYYYSTLLACWLNGTFWKRCLQIAIHRKR